MADSVVSIFSCFGRESHPSVPNILDPTVACPLLCRDVPHDPALKNFHGRGLGPLFPFCLLSVVARALPFNFLLFWVGYRPRPTQYTGWSRSLDVYPIVVTWSPSPETTRIAGAITRTNERKQTHKKTHKIVCGVQCSTVLYCGDYLVN